MKQIGLDFGLTPDYSKKNYFIESGNATIFDVLLNSKLWGGYLLLLVGETGAGKTHLCHIYSEEYDVPYVSGENITIDTLPFYAEKGCVVDNANLADETLLFHLLNMVRENNMKIVLSALQVPMIWQIKLPDLKSRLMQGMLISLSLPSDEILQTILIKHFSDRRLRIPSDVMSYLMVRIPRSYSGVSALVDRIDTMALSQKAEITIPFVRKVLERMYDEKVL